MSTRVPMPKMLQSWRDGEVSTGEFLLYLSNSIEQFAIKRIVAEVALSLLEVEDEATLDINQEETKKDD